MSNYPSIFDLSGKVGIVTGSGRGLGKAMARILADAGMTTVMTDVDEASVTAACEEIVGEGGKAVSMRVDVSSENDVVQMVSRVMELFGHIDVLVNNAGIGSRSDITTITLEEWNQVIGINLTGTLLCCREVAKVMMQQRSGKIINLSSIWGQYGGGGLSYAASKGGINQLTKTLAVQLAEYGINVNAIAPMHMQTDMIKFLTSDEQRYARIIDHTPLQRLGEPDELSGAVLLLASSASNYITGHILNVDGGFAVG